MFISLSSSYACNASAVRQSIIDYTGQNDKSQFFDWLITSMKSVNEILSGKPILFEPTYIYPNISNTTTIKFLNFDLLISHHDITIFDDDSINILTAKYIRRYERFIDTIKTQHTIYFIRYCKNQQDLEEEIIKFIINIIIINPKLDFHFVLISDCDDLLIHPTILNMIKFINLNTHLVDNDYTDNTYLNTVKQYKCIYNLIK